MIDLMARPKKAMKKNPRRAFPRRPLGGPSRVEREHIVQWLDEREAARGGEALEPDAVQFADQAWRNRTSLA